MDQRYHSIQLTPSSASAVIGATTELQASNGGRRQLDMSTDLYQAACKGRTSAVMAMITKQDVGGSGIRHLSAGGNTVLHLAAREGHVKLIRELHACFTDNSLLLSSLNSALDTPLHCAARAGHDNAVRLLLQLEREYGGQNSLSCKNEAGDLALHLAARFGHGAAVEAMISQAPELASEVNYAGVSPLYMAVISRSVPAVRAITTNCMDASAAGPDLQNALHAAVFQSSEMVALLMQWKPSLATDVDGSGSSPLHFASSDGDLSIVRAILHAAPPSMARMRDLDGRSALHVAAGMDHYNVVKDLMKAYPDAAELRDNHGANFMHTAAKGGHSKVMTLAIKKRTLRGLLNAQDKDGNTLVHLAVEAGAYDIAYELIRHGRVRADVMNNNGQTALDIAMKSTDFFSMLNLVVTLSGFDAQSRPQRQDHVEQWDDHGQVAKGIQKTSDGLMVVAILVATVAFSAANNVPGSYKADNGTAVLQEMIVFKCYMILNSIALTTSVVAVPLLVYGKVAGSTGRSLMSFVAALQLIFISLITTILAFYAALAAVTDTMAVSGIVYYVLYIFLLPGIMIVCLRFTGKRSLSRTVYKSMSSSLCSSPMKGRHGVTRRRVGRKYPFINAYVPSLFLFSFTYNVAIIVLIIVNKLDQNAASKYSGAPAPIPY